MREVLTTGLQKEQEDRVQVRYWRYWRTYEGKGAVRGGVVRQGRKHGGGGWPGLGERDNDCTQLFFKSLCFLFLFMFQPSVSYFEQ